MCTLEISLFFYHSDFTWNQGYKDGQFRQFFRQWLFSTLWKLRKFTLTEKKFRQITYLVISLVKLLLSRNFCQKCVRVNSRNFHTVQEWLFRIGSLYFCCEFVSSFIFQKLCTYFDEIIFVSFLRIDITFFKLVFQFFTTSLCNGIFASLMEK